MLSEQGHINIHHCLRQESLGWTKPIIPQTQVEPKSLQPVEEVLMMTGWPPRRMQQGSLGRKNGLASVG